MVFHFVSLFEFFLFLATVGFVLFR